MSSAAGKRHLALVHRMLCVICLHKHDRKRPCEEAHHIEAYRDDHSDFATVPLCHECHQQLHAMHRRPFYLLYNLDDGEFLSWKIMQMEAK